ncbi:MAG: thermonuclease family protein [Elusimicrobium sp.]|jgi:endonuclease YncB( thermonuclease family)|nr:thermonuclease family protein [Elusimicrobium sp.]
MARKNKTFKLIFLIAAAAFAFFFYSGQDALNVVVNFINTGRVTLPVKEIDKTVKQFTAAVIKVHDGDTITVRTPQGEEGRLRLYGIDAPELAQTYGDESRRALAAYLDGKTVEIEVMDTDQYGRMVSKIGDANKYMIESGNAWVYVNYCKIPDCAQWQKLEAGARENKTGLWAAKSPVPPWKWRRANK